MTYFLFSFHVILGGWVVKKLVNQQINQPNIYIF